MNRQAIDFPLSWPAATIGVKGTDFTSFLRLAEE